MALKIGAIIEVKTPEGFGYAQYTHKHENYGYLIRVMKGLYDTPQTDVEMLVSQPSLFSIFFPLGTAVRRKDAKLVGNRPVPEFAAKFPKFKQGTPHPQTNKVSTWHFWDGETRWSSTQLTEEEKDYSNLRLAPLDALLYHIGNQTTPRSEGERLGYF